MTAPEVRAGCEFRVAGRTLSGRVMTYGDISPEHRERFLPGAFGPAPSAPLNIQHDHKMIVLGAGDYVLTDTDRALEIRAELSPSSAALELVRRGALNGYSVEFHARAERRESGVRVIERAALVGIGLVDAPSYPGSTAEIRARARGTGKTARLKAGRLLRSRIPIDRSLACECLKRGGGAACIPLARFSRTAGDGMAAAINDALAEARDVLAVMGEYKRPIASASRGTLRAVSTDDGLNIEMDLPAGEVGDAVVAAHEAAGVIVRPLIDFAKSEFVDTDRGREYVKPWLRALLVGVSDQKGGWPDPVIETPGKPKTTAEKIAALAKIGQRRNRLWF